MSKKTNIKEVSIEEFMKAIEKLPANEYRDRWLRWLGGYNEPGPYDRQPDKGHNARYVYNHLAYPEMLLWLIEAAGIEKEVVKRAESDSKQYPDNLQKQCAAIRKCVPWDVLERALWQ